MKSLILIFLLLVSSLGFAESYDSVNTLENKIEEDRFKSVKYVHIHGNNPDVDAAEDIIPTGGNYVGFPGGSGELFEVFSSDAADTSAGTGAQTVRVFYLDDDKNCFDSADNFLFFDIIMNGVTGVDSTISGRRVYRVVVLTTGSGGTNAGTITVRNKTTTANIFSVMQIGDGISKEAVFTVCKGYTAHLELGLLSMIDTGANRSIVVFTEKLDNGTTRLGEGFAVATDSSINIEKGHGIKWNEKEDIKLRVTSIINMDATVHGGFKVRLVKNPN